MVQLQSEHLWKLTWKWDVSYAAGNCTLCSDDWTSGPLVPNVCYKITGQNQNQEEHENKKET